MTKLLALTVMLLAAFAALNAAEETERPPALPTAHTTRNIEGWTVRVDHRLLKGDSAAVGERACTNMVVSYKLKSVDGTKLSQELDDTISFIPGGERSPGMFPPEPKKKIK